MVNHVIISHNHPLQLKQSHNLMIILSNKPKYIDKNFDYHYSIDESDDEGLDKSIGGKMGRVDVSNERLSDNYSGK